VAVGADVAVGDNVGVRQGRVGVRQS
jgi:hypothetical protein